MTVNGSGRRQSLGNDVGRNILQRIGKLGGLLFGSLHLLEGFSLLAHRDWAVADLDGRLRHGLSERHAAGQENPLECSLELAAGSHGRVTPSEWQASVGAENELLLREISGVGSKFPPSTEIFG